MLVKQKKYNKLVSIKRCSRCRFFKPINRFLSCKTWNTISATCDVCRIKNASRYIARDHNKRESIFKTLFSEKISRESLYLIYLNQNKKCFVCGRILNIPLAYINKFNQSNYYNNNIFLSCSICYHLNDDDFDMHEFRDMICDSNYPFNSVSIKSSIQIKNKLLNATVKRNS